MNPMKRLGLAAALGVGVTLLATTLVRAGNNGHSYELLNVCDSGDQDADATGQVTFGGWRWQKVEGTDGVIYTWVEQKVTIKCTNLTPGATYETSAGTFTADRKGNGNAVRIVAAAFPVPMDAFVYRVNTDGSPTLVLAWWWRGGP